MKKLFIQCHLERSIPNGKSITTTWLPKKYAVVGKVLKLKDSNGRWSDGWIVTSLESGQEPLPMYIDKVIREHRKRTGDSLPKMNNKIATGR